MSAPAVKLVCGLPVLSMKVHVVVCVCHGSLVGSSVFMDLSCIVTLSVVYKQKPSLNECVYVLIRKSKACVIWIFYGNLMELPDKEEFWIYLPLSDPSAPGVLDVND